MMLRLFIAAVFLVASFSAARSHCEEGNAIWAAEEGDKRYVVYRSRGISGTAFGGFIIEEWRQARLAWRLEADASCSMGHVTCHIAVRNTLEPPGEEWSSAVVERINPNDDHVAEWLVFAGLQQKLWYSGGAKVVWFSGFGPEEYERATPPNVYRLHSCRTDPEPQPPMPAQSLAAPAQELRVLKRGQPARWIVTENGVRLRSNEQIALGLGDAFSRSGVDELLDGVAANVVYTELEDCGKCFYIDIPETGHLFIDSPDADVITHISAYGPAFVDSHGMLGSQNLEQGTSLWCDDGMEEVCLREKDGAVGYIIDRDACLTALPTPSAGELQEREFRGCEIVSGFSIGAFSPGAAD